MEAPSTNSFLDSIGVVTHIGYTDIAWGNWDAIPGMLDYTGIRHVREVHPVERTMPMFERLAEMGVKFNLGVRGPELDLRESVATIARLEEAVPGSVAFVEGPNELNLFPYTYRGKTVREDRLGVARDIHVELKRLVDANDALDDVPIISFSVGAVGPWRVAEQVGDLSHLTDYSNWHTYFGGRQPREVSAETKGWAQILNPDPVMFTEAGYHNALGVAREGVDEETEAKLTLNMLLDNFQLGVRKTYVYALMNDRVDADPRDPEDNFGLFDGDGTPQPVADALHNLNAILRDGDDYSATFDTDALAYDLDGASEGTYHLLMQKSDGTFALAVWAEPDIWDEQADRPIEAPARRLSVELDGRFDVALYDPLESSDPLAEADGVRRYDFEVVDHPVIMELRAAGPQVGASDPAPGGSPAAEIIAAFNLGGEQAVGAFAPDDLGLGRRWVTTSQIEGTREDALYRTSLWARDGLSFAFDVPHAGTYELEVHLAETWSGAFGAGKRVFDVVAEGETLDDDVDVFARAGADTALVERYRVEVSDGTLDLEFEGEVQNPSVAGLKVSLVEPRGGGGAAATAPGTVGLQLVRAVDIGGGGHVASNGVAFEADDTGVGRRGRFDNPISGTLDDPLYVTEVYGRDGLDYSLDVQDGTHLVALHFAEIWEGAHEEGARVFDVLLEGRRVEDDLDVFREAGGRDAALVKGYLVDVRDGALDLSLVGEVQNPALKALEVYRLDGSETEVVRAINLGSRQSVTAADGTVYAADDTGTGSAFVRSNPIRGTADDGLYQSEVWSPGELGWDFDVGDGLYEVELHFAEIFDGASRVGARVFDVEIEGRTVEDDLDVFAEAGGRTALVRTHLARVDDGVLDVDLVAEIENPALKAIRISRVLEGAAASQDVGGRYTVKGVDPDDGRFELVPTDDGFAVDGLL